MKGKEKKTWKNLGLRISTALIFAAICIVPLYLGGAVWAILVFAIGLRMIWEWVNMTDVNPTLATYFIPMFGLTIALTYMYLNYGFFAALALILSAVGAYLEKAYRIAKQQGSDAGSAPEEKLLRWAAIGVFYIFIPCMAIIWLRNGGLGNSGLGNSGLGSGAKGFNASGFRLLLYVILIVIAADTGAYFGGSYFGGPKLVPKLSPKKTWSGLFSGLLAGMAVGALCTSLLQVNPLISAALAIPVVLLSVGGDFLESAFKRRLQVKDAGDLLPGHGGMLDRIDSLMLAVSGVALAALFWPYTLPITLSF